LVGAFAAIFRIPGLIVVHDKTFDQELHFQVLIQLSGSPDSERKLLSLADKMGRIRGIPVVLNQ
jgi:hypothetical protein